MTTEDNLNQKIWRYLSFDKFIDLLKTSELHFSPASQFGDRWEMYPPPYLRDRNKWKKVLKNNSQILDGSCDIEKCIDSIIGYFEHSYINNDKEYSFSCWSKNKQDSAALWNIYTDKKSAVAISTTPRKIFEAFNIPDNNKIKSKFTINDVLYIDYSDDNLELLETDGLAPLPYSFKHQSYAFEKEIRLTLFSDQFSDPINRVKFDLNMLIDEVIIGPEANKSFKDHIIKISKSNIPKATIKDSKLKIFNNNFETSYTDKMNNLRKVRQERSDTGHKIIIFNSIEDFKLWHEKVTDYLGIPHFGRRNGHLNYDSGITTAWAQPKYHQNNSDDKRVWAPATQSITFGHALLDRQILDDENWFSIPKECK